MVKFWSAEIHKYEGFTTTRFLTTGFLEAITTVTQLNLQLSDGVGIQQEVGKGVKMAECEYSHL